MRSPLGERTQLLPTAHLTMLPVNLALQPAHLTMLPVNLALQPVNLALQPVNLALQPVLNLADTFLLTTFNSCQQIHKLRDSLNQGVSTNAHSQIPRSQQPSS
ncbi:MAG: hypothetical protein KME26_01570 [Oscillatoria princeps RMCB-10]|nr:hypothetical protein [Oscillatoria princeps RMCB-10]